MWYAAMVTFHGRQKWQKDHYIKLYQATIPGSTKPAYSKNHQDGTKKTPSPQT